MSDVLKEIAPSKIERNPDNPRIFFRDEEMDTLTASIRRYGIQVPITVYSEGSHFILIDGERRWRCARKLNLKSMPALVRDKPSRLKNILLMFNIHALREQWDYLTIAHKLPDVIELFQKDNSGREPTEAELSELTGLTRGQIRRCGFLLDLPTKYREILEEELALPKQFQKLSEDFFIEMERALKTVQHRVPTAIKNLNSARDALIAKFRNDTIGNITDFRMLSKIATSVKRLGVRETKAREALKSIFDPHSKIGIEQVFAEQFEMKFDERKVIHSADSIYDFLEHSLSDNSTTKASDQLRKSLSRLHRLIERFLKS
ncbi:MAG TPA: ParB/RepB/Spo0J family partition protein [Xanthobacteraceae bacterium]|nr:ParB/RepB/Spo0J family partition protein [Xanthobacteraceae bacterium]